MHTHEFDTILKHYLDARTKAVENPENLTGDPREDMKIALGSDATDALDLLQESKEFSNYVEDTLPRLIETGPIALAPIFAEGFLIGLRYAKATSQMSHREPVAA